MRHSLAESVLPARASASTALMARPPASPACSAAIICAGSASLARREISAPSALIRITVG
jgi:hypothetical protein